jgi:hypothetical protein
MIRQSTLMALCEEAGVDPHYVSSVDINHREATFTMLSQDIRGQRMLNRNKDGIVTYWVKAQVSHE